MDTFFQAFLLGFSIAAPVGPIGLLCIRRTLAEGRAIGFASGLGAATADALYGLIAALGLTAVATFLTAADVPLRLAGAIYLAVLGVRIFRADPARKSAAATSTGALRAWGSTFLLTITNPATIISFAAMLGALGLATSTTTTDPSMSRAASGALLVSGVFIGSAAWWLTLSLGVGQIRHKLSEAHLRVVNYASGAIILAFAAWATWSVVQVAV